MTYQSLRQLIRRSAAVAAAAFALLAAGQVQAGLVTIDFDTLAQTPISSPFTGPLVYPEATFTSEFGDFLINNFTATESAPNSICPFVADAFVNCAASLTVDFTNLVSDLVFFVGSRDILSQQPIMRVSYFQNGSDTATGSILVPSDPSIPGTTAQRVDALSGFTNVSRIRIINEDPAGLTYDTFSFRTSSVPVPATVWLFGLGLAGIGAMRRRKLAA